MLLLSLSILILTAAYVGYWTGRIHQLESDRRLRIRHWRAANTRTRIHHARHLRSQKPRATWPHSLN